MALIYNGVNPTTINYNGTSLTVLKYGSTPVWGKPYSLTASIGSNVTLTVTRTSSPNQNASIGALSSGSVVYYGDKIKISYSTNSGYEIDTHTINGRTFNNGVEITVADSVNVIVTAKSSASWHTEWSGSTQLKTSDTFITTVSSSAQKYRFQVSVVADDGDTGAEIYETSGSSFTLYGYYTDWDNDESVRVSVGTCYLTVEEQESEPEYSDLYLRVGTLSADNHTFTAKIVKIESYY